jgi:gentisate 1,2-dioxygenase
MEAVAIKTEDFYEELARENLEGLWRIIMKLLPREPITEIQPYLWKWETLFHTLYRAGDFVSVERGGERRVLLLVNPGLKHNWATTPTVAAAVQLIKPGEIAPAHRHTPAAIRFIIQGSGAYTTVEGERVPMEEGDLTLTPGWTWHDHGNHSDEPVIWLDGLDYPLVQSLQAIFFQLYHQTEQPLTKPSGYTAGRVGSGLLRPAYQTYSETVLPVIYKWKDAYAALKKLMESEGSLEDENFDGTALEYTNPVTGGHTFPTMSCLLQGLRPGEKTGSHRHTGSSVYHAVRGSGTTIVNGQRLNWAKGDCFSLPPWVWHEHHNGSKREEAILFCLNDRPPLEALGLYREEAAR